MMRVRFALPAVLLAACVETESSAELTEPGRIEQVTYVPSGHGSGTTFTPGAKGGGVGVSFVDIPERFGVVISCHHGQFALEGEQARKVFKRFKQGDSITIRYREVYEIRENKRRELYDLDFIDASPRGNTSPEPQR